MHFFGGFMRYTLLTGFWMLFGYGVFKLINGFAIVSVYANDPVRLAKLADDATFFQKYGDPSWHVYCVAMMEFLRLPWYKKMFTAVPSCPPVKAPSVARTPR